MYSPRRMITMKRKQEIYYPPPLTITNDVDFPDEIDVSSCSGTDFTVG